MASRVGGANPLRCNDCGRDFGRGEHLRRHRRIHTREKPYACHCGQAFARRDLLTRHQRLHHVKTTPISTSTAPSSLQTPNTPLDNLSSILPAPDHGSGCEVGPGISDFLASAGLDLDFDIDDFIHHDFIADAGQSPWRGFGGCSVMAHERGPDDVANTTADTTTGSAPIGSRIPVVSSGDDDFQELKPFTQPWKVTEQDRRQFARTLEPYAACMQDFMLPSRLSMARYVAGFVDGFTHHHPFIHMPTFRITNYTRSPELILALLAVGAQYRYEDSRSLSLYRAGRSIVLRRMLSGELSSVGNIGLSTLSSEQCFGGLGVSETVTKPVDILGAILLLSTFASWQADPALVRESLDYQPLLARLARDCSLCEEQLSDVNGDADGDDWLKWVPRETSRRTKFSVFTFLNLQSIALGLPPVLMSNEINLRLPTSCRQWLAQDQESWLAAREEGPQATYFRDMLCRLCANSDNDHENDHNSAGAGIRDTDPMQVTTPFGNFVLIHALLQRLVLSWQFFHTSCLPTSNVSSSIQKPLHQQPHPNGSDFEKSLRRWRKSWQKAPECLLDLMNSKDSLSWSATSLLGLAHVRVHFDLGSRRSELLRLNDPRSSPGVIADMALAAPPPARGPYLLNALLHSVHALSVPAQLGIHYLANCHAFFLSLQHALCFFECAVFLSKWLLSLCGDDESERGVTDMESQVVNWAVAMVSEVQASQGLSSDDTGLPPILSSGDEEALEATHPTKLQQLAIAVVDIFAQMFGKCNSVWPAMAVIGEGLEVYSRLLSEK